MQTSYLLLRYSRSPKYKKIINLGRAKSGIMDNLNHIPYVFYMPKKSGSVYISCTAIDIPFLLLYIPNHVWVVMKSVGDI